MTGTSHPINTGSEYKKRRPLTPVKILRGVICLVVLLSTAFMFLIYFAPAAAVCLRFFSIHRSRKLSSFLFGIWLALWPFFFEKINKTKVVFSGETVPPRERALLIANHRTEVDWMYLWDLALRKESLGYIKYILKSSLMKMPIFGWGFHILEFISVERKWEIDEPVLRQMLSTFKNPKDPLWLAVFPEGTDYTDLKCKRSQEFAAANDLPLMNYVLLPKTKGFHACLEILRESLDAGKKPLKVLSRYKYVHDILKVYDVTIAYKHGCPSLMDNVFGVEPSEVHMHVRRIPLDEIPSSESEASDWLMNRFQLKDQLISDFVAQGHFPCEGTEGELPMLNCLVNFAVVISLTGLFMYLTFFSSVWFKIYIVVACAYLAYATAHNIRPAPLLGILRSNYQKNM